MCSLITPILLAIETVTDMKPEEARKQPKFTPKLTQTHNCQTCVSTVAGPESKQKLGSLLLHQIKENQTVRICGEFLDGQRTLSIARYRKAYFQSRTILQTKRNQSIAAQKSIATKCLFSAGKYLTLMHLFAEKPFSHKILQNW